MAVPIGSSLDAPLKATKNQLEDICLWLQDDAYVVIYVAAKIMEARYFHNKCFHDVKTDEQIQHFLDTHRIIYINISKFPQFLEEGALNAMIKQAGYPECTCNLKDRVSWIENIPHVSQVTLARINHS
jgi:hypothetical protein